MPASRRGFLKAAGLALAAGVPAAAIEFRPERSRAARSLLLREGAAREEMQAAAEAERDNGDELRYANRIGNYSKGLPHNDVGEVEPAAYRTLLQALTADADEAGVERVRLGGNQKLVNPLAGIAYDLEGVDIQKLAAPPAPALASEERARQMVELYWMALCRDVPFTDFTTDAAAGAAARELGIPAGRLFRGFTAGDAYGPYVSQLFLTPFAYGQYLLDGRITTFAAGSDYLVQPNAWLACQNGQGPFGAPQLDQEARYIRCGRDLAAYVHSDQACQAFYNAGLRLYALNAPANPGNPYLRLRAQAPFATFGPPHFLTLQAEAALRAVKAFFTRSGSFTAHCVRRSLAVWSRRR
ncbi:MAG TPA: twin-arginine translocation signal domain-containing protein [Terriglobales bacterium]|nr:twin-arginine translocation signal domain-containing protein [Terriglobales bacterium]